MDHEFWHQAWSERRIGFHRSEFHPQLLEGIKKANLESGSRCLVPLCGKSLDLLWLLEQKHSVTGVEISPTAVEEFFEENQLNPEKVNENHYRIPSLDLIIGDFFSFRPEKKFDFLYDRAALVALPPAMRKEYASHSMDLLKVGGQLLLVSFEYDQEKVQGPPHSVEKAEIQEIYKNMKIEIFHEKTDTPRAPKFQENNVKTFRQVSYLMTKLG